MSIQSNKPMPSNEIIGTDHQMKNKNAPLCHAPTKNHCIIPNKKNKKRVEKGRNSLWCTRRSGPY